LKMEKDKAAKDKGGSTGGGGGEATAIRMMAEKAQNKASQMMEMEMLKMETIKRRQKREIDRVVENEGLMATLQAKILKAEEEEGEKKREHEKSVAETRKVEIARKQVTALEKKRQLDEEIVERNKIAAKEMDVERKLAAREKDEAIVRRREAREKEIYSAQLMVARQAKTQKIFSDLEAEAERSRLKIQDRNDRISAAFEEKKRLKEIDIRENRMKAEKRIQRAKDDTQAIQVKKKTDYEQRVVDHAIMKAQKIEERRDEVEAAAKRLADKHVRQKSAYADAMGLNEDFRNKTIRLAVERDGYYDQVQQEIRKVQVKQATLNGIRQDEVLDNVARINKIHSSIQHQRQLAQDADDDRTDTIKLAKRGLVEERKQIAHDAGMRKWRVKEAMEKMKISNKFGNLEKELNKAMGPNGGGGTVSISPEPE